MKGRPQGRRRTAVLASAPQFCAVCARRRRVWVAGSLLPDLPPGDASSCPHCTWLIPIPIYDYPLRTDTPRGAA